LKRGIVIKTTGSWHTVKDGETIVVCKIRGRLREKELRITNPVAVGDQVRYEKDQNGHGLILHIEPRQNYIIRRSSNLSKEAHILAANIDKAFLMITISMPETSLEFTDRFLLTAEAYHIPVILLINKTDLLTGTSLDFMHSVAEIYRHAGYTCLEISVKNGTGLQAVMDSMKDKTSLLAGNSGVGKSSLINRICPAADQKIMDISAFHKTGKHATTYAEMIALPTGGYIIDTPGIRGFGIIDIDKNEIGLYFTDIFRISQDCSFYNCTHIHEPGCAVKKALAEGTLAQSRYQSYVNIFSDRNEKYRL
jgi:ribosome biogenesis GTPase / thiamine phosphate phosphatase